MLWIQRWFKELPERLFQNVDVEEFTDDDYLSVADLMSPTNKTLFQWLMHLLSETARLEAHNKMDAKNLGT